MENTNQQGCVYVFKREREREAGFKELAPCGGL